MRDFLTLDRYALAHWLKEQGLPAFHAKQIFGWVYAKGVRDWDAMTNLSADLRSQLKKDFKLSVTRDPKVQTARNGTRTFQYTLHEGREATALLPITKQGLTLSLSSQLGWLDGCGITGGPKGSFGRNLQAAEILEQLYQTRAWTQKNLERGISKVAFDHMGEPLKNIKAVIAALEALTDPERGAMAPDQISIASVGVFEGIESLLELKQTLPLVIRLHAPNQHVRSKLIPFAKRYPFEPLMELCRRYAQQTGLPVTFEYSLIAGVNDHTDQAFELAQQIKKMRCKLLLIPFRPRGNLKPSDARAQKAFRTVLFGNKISHAIVE